MQETTPDRFLSSTPFFPRLLTAFLGMIPQIGMMRRMRNFPPSRLALLVLGLIGCFCVVSGSALAEQRDEPGIAGGAKLEQERLLFNEEQTKSTARRDSYLGTGGVRLTPDGKRVLIGFKIGQDHYELWCRDIEKGRNRRLIGNIKYKSIVSLPIDWNVLSPDGQRLVIPRLVDAKAQKFRIDVVELSSGKAKPTGISGRGVAVGWFIDNQTLLFRYNAKANETTMTIMDKRGGRPFNTAGLDAPSVSSTNPKGGVICLLPKRLPREGQKLKLYDVEKQKIVADIPVHKDNAFLESSETNWTSDGRYLYYRDRIEKDNGRDTAAGTKVWDREAGKIVALLPGFFPVGQGPAGSSMVLSGDRHTEEGIYLHDAASGKIWRLTDSTKRAESAASGYLVYRRDDTIRIAKIVTPD